MCPGPGRREQRAIRSCPYIRRDSSRHLRELWGPGEPGEHSTSLPSSSLGAINTSLLRGDEGVPPSSSGQSGLVLEGEELSGCLVESLVSRYAIHLRIGLSEVEVDAFMGALGVDRMEDCPVVEMKGEMEVVDVESEYRD